MAPAVHASPLRLRYAHGQGALEAMRQQLVQWLQPYALSARCIYRVETVLEEWLSNVVRHGFAGRVPTDVDIEVAVSEGHVELRFSDEAPAFNPLAAPSPEPYTRLEVARVGGLGLEMIRQSVVSLQHERVDGHNVLRASVARL